ncbi:MAG TPA: HupE/UreJ family protein [Burkholderiaceae bacterium]|nr:HupE/UreJ family protein [Burkholderiaceae bacterium]
MLAGVAAQAQAHMVESGLGPVYDGLLHFVMTPQDLLPVLALAALAGLGGKRHARIAVLFLPLAWLAAGVVGVRVGWPLPDSIAWLPLLLLGGLVAVDRRGSPAVQAILAIALGGWLGYGNGAAMAAAGADVRAVLGSSGAVFIATTLLAACAVAWQAGWMRVAWRVAGSWVAAAGLLLLGWTLR